MHTNTSIVKYWSIWSVFSYFITNISVLQTSYIPLRDKDVLFCLGTKLVWMYNHWCMQLSQIQKSTDSTKIVLHRQWLIKLKNIILSEFFYYTLQIYVAVQFLWCSCSYVEKTHKLCWMYTPVLSMYIRNRYSVFHWYRAMMNLAGLYAHQMGIKYIYIYIFKKQYIYM